MSLIDYGSYEKAIWGDYKVDRAKDFFLVNNSWGLPLLLALQLAFVTYFGPKWMKNRKPFDLRPLMIVLNGLHFGTYGCGILILGYGINLGRDSWACKSKPSEEFRDDVMIRIAYALFCMRLLELFTPIIMVLRCKKGQSPVANSLYNALYILIIYHCMNRYYKDVVYLYPYTDAMKITLRSAYYSLTSPGPDFRRYIWPKNYITGFCLAICVLNVYHLTHMISNNCDGPKIIMYAFLLLSSAEIVFHLTKLFSSKAKISKNEQFADEVDSKLD